MRLPATRYMYIDWSLTRSGFSYYRYFITTFWAIMLGLFGVIHMQNETWAVYIAIYFFSGSNSQILEMAYIYGHDFELHPRIGICWSVLVFVYLIALESIPKSLFISFIKQCSMSTSLLLQQQESNRQFNVYHAFQVGWYQSSTCIGLHVHSMLCVKWVNRYIRK